LTWWTPLTAITPGWCAGRRWAGAAVRLVASKTGGDVHQVRSGQWRAAEVFGLGGCGVELFQSAGRMQGEEPGSVARRQGGQYLESHPELPAPAWLNSPPSRLQHSQCFHFVPRIHREPGRRRKRPHHRLTDAQARQVRTLRTQGEPVAELMDTFKVSSATIYRALQVADDEMDRVSAVAL
jgi:hypothetical protein